MRTWKIQIEIPAVQAISDDSAWVTLRGLSFPNRSDAVAAYHKAAKDHDWPLRLVQSVNLEDSPTTFETYEPPINDGNKCQGCGCGIAPGCDFCGECMCEDDSE